MRTAGVLWPNGYWYGVPAVVVVVVIVVVVVVVIVVVVVVVIVVVVVVIVVVVVGGMASLEYLPASFVQAVGSTTPGFTAGLALLIQGRVESRVTYLALIPVASGIALARWDTGGASRWEVRGEANARADARAGGLRTGGRRALEPIGLGAGTAAAHTQSDG
ncbi:hypothetical protein GPECTOR_22g942 [Gonium pectorale]|uniref:Uncharacterized protein n=1 Tax=Gonium pectorale TaxID=33097 RepID=A0A150GHN0_GONPE|nr:hypothetical protein GPECTOR_22g942 [Gonium pectorale]|eukprot:KXZ49348.1 hypothetical protein GPECTOR_22g942 [Gonium pectorale]